MPRCGTHFVLGAGVTAAAKLIMHELTPVEKRQPLSLGYLLGTAAIGGFAALIPDLLEPALSPRHRGPCHSLTIAAVAFYLLHRLPNTPENELARISLQAYLSHLGADFLTPMSLPLIGLRLA